MQHFGETQDTLIRKLNFCKNNLPHSSYAALAKLHPKHCFEPLGIYKLLLILISGRLERHELKKSRVSFFPSSCMNNLGAIAIMPSANEISWSTTTTTSLFAFG